MLKLRELIGAGLHIGQSRREWNPLSERFIAGYRHTVAVFDLGLSTFFLKRALSFIELSVSRYARGFFYGLSVTDVRSIKALFRFGQIVSYRRWNGGFLTNMRRFKRKIKNFSKLPSFVACLKFETRNYSVLREKHRLRIPLVCAIDSNSSMLHAEYPIPGNAGGRATLNLFNYYFVRSVFSGVSRRIRRIYYEKKNRKQLQQIRAMKNLGKRNKENYYSSGRKRNRTATISFSGLYSTVELSPVRPLYY
jgi:ribosomal protein S2